MKILFVFPNIDCGGYKPVGLTAVMNSCRRAGYEVKLFDTSFIDTKYLIENKLYSGIDQAGEEILNFKPVDTSGYNLIEEKIDIKEELRLILEDFKPDVVGISVLSVEWKLTVHILRTIKSFNKDIITVVGGVHTFADPVGSINEPSLDIICIGEGELVFLELLKKIDEKRDYENTPGFWVKKNGNLFKNQIGQVLLDLDQLPYFDYDLYDERLLYRVYDGKVYRSGDHVITRGCYEKCSYCLYDTMHQANSDNLKVRRYQIDRIISELVYLKRKYNLNFYRFQDATFLSVGKAYLREFSDRYLKEVNIPFVVDASPQTLTEEKVRTLADMGCVSISIGVETGNEKMRAEVCYKPVKNSTIIKAFDLANSHGLRTVSFLMMGFPMETREMYWDSVKIVKKAGIKNPAIGFVYPFKGSKLREQAIKLNLFDEGAEERGEVGYSRGYPAIYNPNISADEYRGLLRTFYLYVKFPNKYWNEIKKAESFTDEGNKVYQKFSKIFNEEELYNKTSFDEKCDLF